MNSMKRQKDLTKEDSPALPTYPPHPTSGQKGSNLLLGKSGGKPLTTPERMKQLGQSRTDAQLWMCLVMEVKSDAAKNNIALEAGMLSS